MGTDGLSTHLSVDGLCVRFGGITALDEVSFQVENRQIVGLIGPNGAGKTTVFNAITRIYEPSAGAIDLNGESLLALAPHEVIRRGVARTFQNVELFKTMTVLDNLLVGMHTLIDPLRSLVFERPHRRRALDMLSLFSLQQLANVPAGALPFAVQKRIEMARALVSQPRLLLLDEPASGLNHEEIDGLAALIRSISDELGLTILLVEHNMAMVMGISDHIVVLDFGRKIAEGAPDIVARDRQVIEAYLGEPA
ncbi:MAG: ATP-binding cassette domain-containing protein [Dehalococcoidia bacterium]|nr:ATP-binding cassette domain-containing protein [Dehalococcoidia bacterium]